MKIAIVVHGRFHAFDLARELVRLGHDVCVVTNYPKRIAARFGISPSHIKNNLLHGIVSRITHKLDTLLHTPLFEELTHRWFGNWAAKIVSRDHFDVIHGFSGVYEEILRKVKDGSLKTLVRGSAHIETQYSLLKQEEERAGTRVEKPSHWIRARECREYELCDLIFVLSSFARNSFINRGVDPLKLRLLLLGTDCSRFRASDDRIAERSRRVRSAARLRVLVVGTFSYRKGAVDLIRIAEETRQIVEFRFVGAISGDAARLQERAAATIEFVPKIPQFDLPQQYEWGDLFLFPTIEDGFAAVLAQAAAAGLPLLATTNCAAPELITQGATGWVLPIRRPDLFIKQLRWCNQHRGELTKMVESAYNKFVPRDWSKVAWDFVADCAAAIKAKQVAINVARA
jgi:glycosyltransferase involved in cell wall biosynthesis